jgi:hypothetical protein
MGVYQVCANKSPGGWGGLYTGERPQGHHGPLVLISYIFAVYLHRFESQRPGFHAVLEHLHHERVPAVLAALPLVHLDEITQLSSIVCSKPLLSLWGD